MYKKLKFGFAKFHNIRWPNIESFNIRRGIWTQLWLGGSGWEFEPILSPQKVKYPSEGMLKLRTDRRIPDKMDPHKATKKTVIHRREFWKWDTFVIHVSYFT